MTFFFRILFLFAFCLSLTACLVGPNYHRPAAVPTPSAYQEASGEWRTAQPRDTVLRGRWWERYHDPQLNALEAKVAISNQNVLYYEAQFRLAVATVREERSFLFPTITTSPGYTRVSSGGAGSGGGGGSSSEGGNMGGGAGGGGGGSFPDSINSYNAPASLSYLVDIWGSVRRALEENKASAQASLGDLENAKLSYQSTLAIDYFDLKGLDSEEKLLRETVKSYANYLVLTQNRYNAGIAAQSDIALAQTQVATTRASLIDVGVARAQYQHAIAVLIGQTPSDFSIAFSPDENTLPAVPIGVPSTLLERRPDIAAAERRVAAANANIGVQSAAYYPQISLNGSAGYASIQLSELFSGPNLAWSVGPVLAQTLFDGGRIKSLVEEARASYESSVATYRQTVLTAFQQVEDALSDLRILAEESKALDLAVTGAQQSLTVSTNQYESGIVDYLTVITAQTTALSNQVNALNVRTRRLVSSVQLIQALGGGWDDSQMKRGSALEQAADAMQPIAAPATPTPPP